MASTINRERRKLMSKLKLGKMTGKEVAEWLGVKYESTYRNNPA
jgi:hypothetical protein